MVHEVKTFLTMVKVAVLGAAGGIGQPLSLLLTLPSETPIHQLALYDIVNAPGVAADLSHINTGIQVSGHVGADQLGDALQGSDVVVIPAGVPRKPGMTRDDLFKINAGIVRDLALGIAKHCPNAFVCVISNPVNSTVPIVAEVLKNQGCYSPRRLFGVTTLDMVRASTFLNQVNASIPVTAPITVIGGHSGHTIIPVFSAHQPGLDQAALEKLVNRVQFGGDEVVQAKGGAGSATLSMAFAAKRFVDAVLAGASGKNVTEVAYVDLDDSVNGATQVRERVGGCQFFATRLSLGKNGIEAVQDFGALNAYEEGLLEKAIGELKPSITKGADFVAQSKL
jgi:malate dehydrogenase